MRHFPPRVTAPWDNSVVVEDGVRGEVVCLDVFHVYGPGNTWHLVDFSSVIRDVWVLANEPLVGLEVNDINLQSRQQANPQRSRDRHKSEGMTSTSSDTNPRITSSKRIRV